jgi:ATP-dependent DNA helicase RecG
VRGGREAEASAAQAAIQAVLRPLAFAARDDFAHADRVRDLESSVERAAARAARGSVPPELRKALRGVRDAFRSELSGAERRAAVEHALALLRPFADTGYAARVLAQPPSVLPGLGPRRAELLAKRGIRTVEDLLFRLPSAYDDRRSLETVASLDVGRHVTFAARVLGSGFSGWRGRGGRGGRMFEAVVGDETGTVELKWFRGGETLERTVRKGALLLVTGDVKRYRFAKEIQHPEVEVLAEPGEEDAPAEAEADAPADAPRRIVPSYAAPEGLHPRALRRAVARAVADYADLVTGRLPESLVAARRLPTPGESLRALHAPGPDADPEALAAARTPAHERLILEELYLLELGLALRRDRIARAPGPPIRVDGPRLRAALRALPFALTGAQQRAWRAIAADLARPHPMSRLLEGDVGSGKTVVAYLAAVAVAESGHQTALMAPTELLAEQHFRTLRRLVGGGTLRVELLTASATAGHAESVRAGLAAGEIDVAVGTHALLQESVGFRSRGLVVVDEQHRFGVRQRAALRGAGEGGAQPHTLVMTATPIPRTLAMTLHGDLDLTVIDELPPGRHPVRTLLLRAGEGKEVARLLRETAARGEQVYVVYPLIEESEKSDLRAASESAERIAAAFPDLRVDLVHGRLDAVSRHEAMQRFERGETQVLVSTTVVEVGVDVANATLMIVEHAERFGLAQLHQLRGRVGRGRRPGTCVLVARGTGEGSEARLAAMLETTDGFAIADADLRIRGPGEFFGTRQHGRLPDLRIADLVRDRRWLGVARDAAREALARDPGLRRDPPLRDAVRARWGEALDLSEVG